MLLFLFSFAIAAIPTTLATNSSIDADKCTVGLTIDYTDRLNILEQELRTMENLWKMKPAELWSMLVKLEKRINKLAATSCSC